MQTGSAASRRETPNAASKPKDRCWEGRRRRARVFRVRLPVLVSVCALAVASGGCSPYVDRGEALYREGRYVEAAEVFELTEQRLAASPAPVQAEYGLFRGLTFLRLDDLRSARQWLGYASAVEQRNPGLLESSQRSLLERGWSELEQRSRSLPVANEPTERVAATDPSGGSHAVGPSTNGHRSVPSPQVERGIRAELVTVACAAGRDL